MSEAPLSQTANQATPEAKSAPKSDTYGQLMDQAIHDEYQRQLFGDDAVSSTSPNPTDIPGNESSSAQAQPGSTPSDSELVFGKYKTLEAAKEGFEQTRAEGLRQKARADQFERELALLKASTSHPGTSPGAGPAAGEPQPSAQLQTVLQRAEDLGGAEMREVFSDLLKSIGVNPTPSTAFPPAQPGQVAGLSDEIIALSQRHFFDAYPAAKDNQAFSEFCDGIAQSADPYAQMQVLWHAFEAKARPDQLDARVKAAEEAAFKKGFESADGHWKAKLRTNSLVVGSSGPAGAAPDEDKALRAHIFGAEYAN